jgi:hypothetical protein
MTYKLLSYQAGREARAGMLVQNGVYDAAKVTGVSAYSSVLGILGEWPKATRSLTRVAKRLASGTSRMKARPLERVKPGKAKTAALTRRPTKFWEDRVKERAVFLKFPDNLPIQGGVPILYQNECVGAIGVSGVQSHEDEQIATAGVAALG